MKQTATELAKVSPPGGLVGLNLFGVPIPEVVAVMTLIYTVFLIVDKAVDMHRKWKKDRHGKSD